MAMIVSIAQQKGGVGKTSRAAHLATAWLRENVGADARRQVTLFDLDPQQSLSSWFRLREELYGRDERLALRSVGALKLAAEIEKERSRSDFIVIDTPPHTEDAARAGIRWADLVVVPLHLSPLDIWAARPTFELILKEKRKALYVFNRVPKRALMATSIAEALRKENLPIANAALGNRIAFASSMMRGQGVVESEPRSAGPRRSASSLWRSWGNCIKRLASMTGGEFFAVGQFQLVPPPAEPRDFLSKVEVTFGFALRMSCKAALRALSSATVSDLPTSSRAMTHIRSLVRKC